MQIISFINQTSVQEMITLPIRKACSIRAKFGEILKSKLTVFSINN